MCVLLWWQCDFGKTYHIREIHDKEQGETGCADGDRNRSWRADITGEVDDTPGSKDTLEVDVFILDDLGVTRKLCEGEIGHGAS